MQQEDCTDAAAAQLPQQQPIATDVSTETAQPGNNHATGALSAFDARGALGRPVGLPKEQQNRRGQKPPASVDVGAAAVYGPPVAVPSTHFARMLYTNPVCLLTTCDPSARRANVMTISWLTPTSNASGALLLSMNETRHSAAALQATREFVLSVPVRGMEETVRAVGRCSGAEWARTDAAAMDDGEAAADGGAGEAGDTTSGGNGGKLDALGIRVCAPGWRPVPHMLADDAVAAVASGAVPASSLLPPLASLPASAPFPSRLGVADCVAHLVCVVDHVVAPPQPAVEGEEDAGARAGGAIFPHSVRGPGVSGHLVVFARITEAWVRARYWAAANFAPVTPAPPKPSKNKRKQQQQQQHQQQHKQRKTAEGGVPGGAGAEGDDAALAADGNDAAAGGDAAAADDADATPLSPAPPPYLTFFGGGVFGYVATQAQLRDDVPAAPPAHAQREGVQ